MVLLLSVYKTEKIWLSFIYLLSILDAWRKFGFFVDFLKFVLYCDGRVVTFWPSSCRWRQNYLSLKKICYFHFEQKKNKVSWRSSLFFFFFNKFVFIRCVLCIFFSQQSFQCIGYEYQMIHSAFIMVCKWCLSVSQNILICFSNEFHSLCLSCRGTLVLLWWALKLTALVQGGHQHNEKGTWDILNHLHRWPWRLIFGIWFWLDVLQIICCVQRK